jgi:hypothetical protein
MAQEIESKYAGGLGWLAGVTVNAFAGPLVVTAATTGPGSMRLELIHVPVAPRGRGSER